MMRYSFEDVYAKIEYNLEHPDNGFNFPLMKNLNKVIGNISSNMYTAIGGLPGAGVTSFIDLNYVMSPILQWYINNDHQKRDLKIIYFSTISGELKKIEQLICLFSKLVFGVHLDIPTLHSKPGRLYNLNEEPAAIEALTYARTFFHEILDNQLSIISGELSPTSIHNKILDVLGALDRETTDVMVIIDSVQYLKDDIEKFGTVTGRELDKKMDYMIKEMVDKQAISITIAVPIRSSALRLVKDTEPHYSQLREYSANCDRGLIIYNPIAEKHPNYMQDSKKFISASGLNTLRTWTVVRNTEGKELVSFPILFLPGTGFMLELDSMNDIMDFGDVKTYLQTPKKSPFFNIMGHVEAEKPAASKEKKEDIKEIEDDEYEPEDHEDLED